MAHSSLLLALMPLDTTPLQQGRYRCVRVENSQGRMRAGENAVDRKIL